MSEAAGDKNTKSMKLICMYDNSLGPSAYCHSNIRFYANPYFDTDKPYCVHNTTLLKSSLGQTTTLTCSVRSNPNSNVTINWFANDQVFAANMKADMGNNHIAYHIINIETRYSKSILLSLNRLISNKVLQT